MLAPFFLRDVSRGASQKRVIESFPGVIVMIATNESMVPARERFWNRQREDEEREKIDDNGHAEED
jgi:hypothetical protein